VATFKFPSGSLSLPVTLSVTAVPGVWPSELSSAATGGDLP